MATDWVAWHEGYKAPDSPHSRRLGLIQGHIARVLNEASPGPVRVVSICAGDGRDLLGTLRDHPRRLDVRARLVELDPELAARARQTAEASGLSSIEVVTGDAAATSAYVGAVPVDLVLACGVFGNVSDSDVRNTIGAFPAFCAQGATVIWTRHRRPPDLTPQIRGWFRNAGFTEMAFAAPEAVGGNESRWSWIGVGVHRYAGQDTSLSPDGHLFTFLT